MSDPALFAYEPQGSKLYAIFDNPPAVLACRVNQVFASGDHDMVFEVDIDGVTVGSVAAVKPGMTVLVGSAAGLSDLGITYARKAPAASRLYCGETSEVAWADNAWITVLADFGPWAKYPMILGDGTVYLDRDVAYSDQHANFSPVPIIGDDRIAQLVGASVSLAFDAGATWVQDSTITGHAWVCATATITGPTTATPTLEFVAAGRNLVQYTATAANGKTTTTYRTVHIWDAAHPPSNVVTGSLSRSLERGGIEFTIAALDPATTVRRRTKVLLFAQDFYGTTEQSFGPTEGSENIKAVAWLENEGMSVDANGGEIQFSAKGAHYWLSQISNFVPYGVRWVAGTPSSWIEMKDLTVDLAILDLLYWRTTVLNYADIVLTGDIRLATELAAPSGSILEQIKTIAAQSILASVYFNANGRFIAQVDTALLPAADRASIPTVTSLTKDSWETVDIQVLAVRNVAQVVLSGVEVTGGVGAPLFSLAPGHIPEHYGNVVSYERLLLTDQPQANVLAGSILEKENCPYRFSFRGLLANSRLVECLPRQYVHVTINAADNPRGIAYTGNVFVRSITEDVDKDGAWSITWEADAETQAGLYTNGDIPVKEKEISNDDTITDTSYPPPIVFPPSPPPPPPPPPPDPPAESCLDSSPQTGPFTLEWTDTYISGLDDVRKSFAWKQCTIRSATSLNPTELTIHIYNYGLAYGHCKVYGVDAGEAILCQGTVTPVGPISGTRWYDLVVTFSEVAPILVAGFMLELDAGLDTEAAPLYVNEADIVIEGPYEGGQSSDVTAVRMVYEPTLGHVMIGVAGTLVNGSGILNATLNLQVLTATDPGAVGSTYAKVTYVISSGDNDLFFLRDLFPGDISGNMVIPATYPPFTKLFKTGDHILSSFQGNSRFVFGSGLFNPGTWVIGAIIDLYYSAIVPQRSILISHGHLVNVC